VEKHDHIQHNEGVTLRISREGGGAMERSWAAKEGEGPRMHEHVEAHCILKKLQTARKSKMKKK
jgi:hypothetical protein